MLVMVRRLLLVVVVVRPQGLPLMMPGLRATKAGRECGREEEPMRASHREGDGQKKKDVAAAASHGGLVLSLAASGQPI